MTASLDQRFMATAVRLARTNEGRTGTNPSVACLLVKDEGDGPVIIGRGVTAIGGRPHAEPIAIEEAGERACGATAYVTLEPCAHHGRTPPCAQTLIDAGVARVVTAVIDPDPRVDEKGHAMLLAAGIEVEKGLLDTDAQRGLGAYLTHKRLGRPQVTLKLAVSADGCLGSKGAGQVAITGAISRSQTHLTRARHHAILVGVNTIVEDDPELTCRLPGLEARSPVRVVLDTTGRVPISSKIVQTAREHRTILVGPTGLETHQEAARLGCELLPCELFEGRAALPELLDDLGARGIMSLMVEGGSEVAQSFLRDRLVDELALFSSGVEIGREGDPVKSPVTPQDLPEGFGLTGEWQFGEDRLQTFARDA